MKNKKNIPIAQPLIGNEEAKAVYDLMNRKLKVEK